VNLTYLNVSTSRETKTTGEFLKSMWRSTTTDSTPTPSSTLGGIAESRRRERRQSRARARMYDALAGHT